MLPDGWYLVPFIGRDDMHSMAGALLLCLPAGLAAYAAFHLIFKQPMLALAPRRIAARLGAYAVPGLPPVPWLWVVVSMLAGIATHLAWDSFTHSGVVTLVEHRVFGVRLYRILQHASTLAGGTFLGWWILRKLDDAPLAAEVRSLAPRTRMAVLLAMTLIPALAFAAVLLALKGPIMGLALRAGGVTALAVFGLISLSYAIAWRRRPT